MIHDQPREGLSLASIIDIAANPPAIFDGEQHVHKEPLVLYIARVPGSRDVFLTTLKPRQKVVSAEDVQSCLYYVHASQHEDLEENDTLDEHARLWQNPRQLDPAALSAKSSGNSSHDISLIESKPIARKPVGGPEAVRRKPLPSEARTNRNEQNTNRWRVAAQVPRAHPLPPLPHESHSVPLDLYSPRPSPSTNPTTVLTLIRRDPGTSSQWNVAKVVDPESDDDREPPNRKASSLRKNNNRRPLHVVIMNKNYGCFQNESIPTYSHKNGGQDTELVSQGVLQRSVHIPSHSEDVSYGDALTTTNDVPSRPLSLSSINSNRADEYARRPLSTSSISKRRGPVFVSPWGDLCEFATGITGKSLKCKYLAVDAELSELRFNLPTTSRHPGPSHKADIARQHHKRFSRNPDNWPMQKIPSTSQSDDDHAPLDLTLGREEAGGGFGGKQAKLGKLIIESPGLKMLDLLVAANIGLWWRAYERGRD